ncbi:hypothetical protein HDK64DRAFT_254961 [Phyllosticta capitalensis]|uniref:Uncharacterized protein n=1 Tax=Phyllosticta capitalensis TaxID=121624 RepID=A0ABR1YAS8_9PEZI
MANAASASKLLSLNNGPEDTMTAIFPARKFARERHSSTAAAPTASVPKPRRRQEASKPKPTATRDFLAEFRISLFLRTGLARTVKNSAAGRVFRYLRQIIDLECRSQQESVIPISKGEFATDRTGGLMKPHREEVARHAPARTSRRDQKHTHATRLTARRQESEENIANGKQCHKKCSNERDERNNGNGPAEQQHHAAEKGNSSKLCPMLSSPAYTCPFRSRKSLRKFNHQGPWGVAVAKKGKR